MNLTSLKKYSDSPYLCVYVCIFDVAMQGPYISTTVQQSCLFNNCVIAIFGRHITCGLGFAMAKTKTLFIVPQHTHLWEPFNDSKPFNNSFL